MYSCAGVSLDLRGLPPTPRRSTRFVHDPAPDAYEKAVDRFLADPAYGERWARMWLDLARYADSAGYGSDPLRPNMWRYRDWVSTPSTATCRSINSRSSRSPATCCRSRPSSERMATAFHRNTMTNTEGGTDDEEFRVAAIKDRVDTTMQVWMGLTMGCAKCHSHKFDPITHEEYYKFYAIFNQTADNDQPTRARSSAPTPNDRTARRSTPVAAAQGAGNTTAALPPPGEVGIDLSFNAAAARACRRRSGILDIAREADQAADRGLARHFRTIAPELKRCATRSPRSRSRGRRSRPCR